MGVSLEKQSTIYKTSYAALEQELIRIQIEESVLRNVKKVVRVSLCLRLLALRDDKANCHVCLHSQDERDKLRYAQGAG